MLQDCIFPQHCKAIILQLIFLKILYLSLVFSTLIIIYLTLHYYRFISLRFIQPLELSKFVYFPTLGISRGIISSNHFLEWHFFPLLLRFHDKNARVLLWASQEAQMVKNLPAMQETRVWYLGWEDPLEKGMATHSSTLAWRIPWTEKPSGPQSIGLYRVRHDWSNWLDKMVEWSFEDQVMVPEDLLLTYYCVSTLWDWDKVLQKLYILWISIQYMLLFFP